MSRPTENDVYNFLLQRRSASILHAPSPSRAELEQILALANTVPDHGGLKPYRFVFVEGGARDAFGEALVNAADENRPEKLDDKVKPKIKAKAFAAPLQAIIVFSPIASEKIPEWEQMASASCTGFALTLGANALGYGAVWKSFAYDPGSALKTLCALQPHERILGWVNMGTDQDRDRSARVPLDLRKHATFLN